MVNVSGGYSKMPQSVRRQKSDKNPGDEKNDAPAPSTSAGGSSGAGSDASGQQQPHHKKRSLMKRLSSNLSLLPRRKHSSKRKISAPNSAPAVVGCSSEDEGGHHTVGGATALAFAALRSVTSGDDQLSKYLQQTSGGGNSGTEADMGNKQSGCSGAVGGGGGDADDERVDSTSKKCVGGGNGPPRARLQSAPSQSQEKSLEEVADDGSSEPLPADGVEKTLPNPEETTTAADTDLTMQKGMANLTVSDGAEGTTPDGSGSSDSPTKQDDDASKAGDVEVESMTSQSAEDTAGASSPALADSVNGAAEVGVGPPTGAAAPNKHVLRRAHVIRELVETERNYVKDLGLVVDGYMALMRDPNCEIPMPEDLKGGKDKIVFGNLEAIYEWHKNSFLKSVEGCLDSPMNLGPLFQRCENKLRLYVVYCENKNKSEYIVSEYLDTYFEELRQKLGHKLQLPDLLIKPVQRITKYQLLLKDLYDVTEKAGLTKEAESLRIAVDLMRVVPKEANDMMLIGRIQGFEGRITAQGKLLHSGPLTCQEGTSASNLSKPKDLEVFLFEQSMIFSELTGKKAQFTNPGFIYRNHLKVNNMSLVKKWGDDPLKFVVKSTDLRKDLMYVCQVSSVEMREEWASKIAKILDLQSNFLKALQSPIVYQKELTQKDTRTAYDIRLQNDGTRGRVSRPPRKQRAKTEESRLRRHV